MYFHQIFAVAPHFINLETHRARMPSQKQWFSHGSLSTQVFYNKTHPDTKRFQTNRFGKKSTVIKMEEKQCDGIVEL